MSQTVNVGKQLDRIRRFLGDPDVTLDLYNYNSSSGYALAARIIDSHLSYPQSDITLPSADSRFLEITIADTARVEARATATLSVASQPNDGDELVVGEKIYTLVSASPTVDEIEIGADEQETAENIAVRINADTALTLCTAEANDDAQVELTANEFGESAVDLESDGTRITNEPFDGGTPELSDVLTKATHVRIGSLYYRIRGNPEAPTTQMNAIRYWTVRCDPTGTSTS